MFLVVYYVCNNNEKVHYFYPVPVHINFYIFEGTIAKVLLINVIKKDQSSGNFMMGHNWQNKESWMCAEQNNWM